MRAPRLAFGTLAVMLLAPPAAADVIRFKDGSRMRGTIVKRTASEVIVQLDFGTMSFAPTDIISVEPEPEPETDADIAPAPIQAMAVEEPAPAGAAAASIPQEATPAASREVSLPAAMKAIAFIATLHEDGTVGVGSGTLISDKGTMVTNYHVVAHATKIAVLLPGDRSASKTKPPTPHEARVLRADPCYDLAVLSIPRKTPEYLRFSDEDEIRVGSEVRAIGNPQGLAVSVSKGIVSAVRTLKDMTLGMMDAGELQIPECAQMSGRELGHFMLIQTDAAVNPGNSGGPLLNGRNEVIGINTLIFSQSGGSEGLGFAVHVKHVRKFAGGFAQKDATPSQR